jgi:hypothetical protein
MNTTVISSDQISVDQITVNQVTLSKSYLIEQLERCKMSIENYNQAILNEQAKMADIQSKIDMFNTPKVVEAINQIKMDNVDAPIEITQ